MTKKRFSRILGALLAMLFCGALWLPAQEFNVGKKSVQVHGFASQGIVYSTGNNWLTMKTTDGSAGWTEMGLNMSSQLTDKLRIGAQVYMRNMGQLGQYHPQFDWGLVDYKFANWLGIRGGKVKTTLGLFNETQDLDFLRVFALMPQGVYPLDLRDTDIAHTGGDVYGKVSLGPKWGSLAYNGWAGYRKDSIYSGMPYFLATRNVEIWTVNYRGWQYGGDLRWMPRRGITVGLSRLTEDLEGNYVKYTTGAAKEKSAQPDWINQFYGEYVWKNLTLDAEVRRYFRDHLVRNYTAEDKDNIHAWYIAGSYQLMKKLAVGAYFSHYTITSTDNKLFDTSLPNAHNYDKVITGRYDLKRYWNVKVEGHFMDGYAFGPYPNGFYPQQNTTWAPSTKALVLKTGINF